jgi:lysozyme family protein
MNSHLLTYINDLIDREGGYVNNPNDRGGETNWGVTAKVARAYGYNGPMRDMPRSTAVKIYTSRYWNAPGFSKVADLHQELAEAMFDFGVNSGTKVSVKTLQRLLNALNRQGRDYEDINADGAIGPITIYTLGEFKQTRGQEGMDVLLYAFNAIRTSYLLDITESRETQEEFFYGWVRRVFHLDNKNK